MQSPGAIKILVTVLAVAASVAAGGCGSSSDETTGAGQTTAPNPPASTSTAPGQEAPIGVRAKSCKGDSSGGEIRVTGAPCPFSRLLVAGWYKNDACSAPAGASRTSCKLGSFTCLGVATDRGLAVTCARPGVSVAFVGKPD
jgi:hypothetical protein